MKLNAILVILGLLIASTLANCSPQSADSSAPTSEKNDDDTGISTEDYPALPIFPKSPPPGTLEVYDTRYDSLEMKLLLISLQGVVNRTQPRIFLITADAEVFWLNEAKTTFSLTTEDVTDPWELVEQFKDEIDGAVVYDPDLIQSVNVATTFAGLNNALVAHPSLVSQIEQHGISVIKDLRGQFDDNVEMYRWAFEKLWPSCHHRILAFLNAETPTLRDYLVAHRIFTLQLDFHRPKERELLEEILDKTPRNIPVLGWVIDELIGVATLSKYGKFLTASDNSPNLSVYSGLELEKPGYDEPPDIPEPENIIYVGFAYTDADNLAYVQGSMLTQWLDPARGTVPLGWSFNAAARDLAPHLVAYYQRTKTEQDVLIGPPSGIGYMYPNLYPDLDTFLKITKPYFEWSGFRTIWLINNDLTLSDKIVTAYTKYLALDGIFIDYWPNGDRGFHFASDGTPVLRSWYVYLLGPEQISDILADAAVAKEYFYPDSPFFVFIGVNAWITPPSYIADIANGLDERYQVVRPDVMFGLMKKAHEQGWIE